MKLLHVVPSYLPAWRYGGPIGAIHSLCAELVRAGHEVTVYTTDADGPQRLDVPSDRAVLLDGVRVHYFPRATPWRLYRAPALAAAAHAHVREFDLVHLHSVFLWPTWAVARAAEQAQTPWILSPRGMLVRELVRARGRLRKSLWLRAFERRTLERAAAVHATSALEAERLAEFDFELPAIECVPNGVERYPDTPPAPDNAALRRRATGRTRLLYLGRLSWKKRTHELLEAVAELPELELVIAGPDDEGLRPGLERRAAELDCAERTQLVGEVHGADKQHLLGSSDALVLASHSENFGNVVLEAMAAGTPALVGSEVGAAELVQRAGCGLCIDGAQLGAGLRSFLALSSEARGSMGARGRAYARRELGWDAVALEMARAYERALGLPSTAARRAA